MATKTKTPPTARRSLNAMPLRVQRSGIIVHRIMRASDMADSMLGTSYTCNKFRNDLENVLGEAAHEFCRWLYAEANGRHKEARRCWDEVQQIVEYELPLVILYGKKVRKTRRGREKVIDKALSLVQKELLPKAQWFWELEHAKWNTASRRRFKRPDRGRWDEFLPWVKEVIGKTLDHEEMADAFDKREAKRRESKNRTKATAKKDV